MPNQASNQAAGSTQARSLDTIFQLRLTKVLLPILCLVASRSYVQAQLGFCDLLVGLLEPPKSIAFYLFLPLARLLCRLCCSSLGSGDARALALLMTAELFLRSSLAR